MYIPKLFREDNLDTLHTLMREYSFATLITQHNGAPFASHLPFLLQTDAGPYGTLVGHMARANPQWQDFATGQEALVIFQGPHAYISPSWYAVHPSVPTWNYAVAHAYGSPQVIDSGTALYEVLQALVQTYEAPSPRPWALDVPDDYLHHMMRGIVGFHMRITRLEGKYKLSQNRPAQDYPRIVEALQQQGDALSTDVAALMRQRGVTTP
ncbi:MAG TPA: FMN-binding negative transcriptional regulator [Candidatus Tectomicrobia bacterium]|jgi:transcriptional regulator